MTPVVAFGILTLALLYLQCVISLFFSFFKSNINCSTVFHGAKNWRDVNMSSLQLIINDVCSNYTTNIPRKTSEREKQRQTARKGPLPVFTPDLEVLIWMPCVLNCKKTRSTFLYKNRGLRWRSSLICWENNRTNNRTMNNRAAWYQGPVKLEVVKSCVVSAEVKRSIEFEFRFSVPVKYLINQYFSLNTKPSADC